MTTQNKTPFTFDQYQLWCQQFKKWPNNRSLEYLALGMVGEPGEATEIIKKAIRKLPENHVGSVKEVLTDEEKGRIADEVMDAIFYNVSVLHDLGITVSDAFYTHHLPKLAGRHGRPGDLKPYEFKS